MKWTLFGLSMGVCVVIGGMKSVSATTTIEDSVISNFTTLGSLSRLSDGTVRETRILKDHKHNGVRVIDLGIDYMRGTFTLEFRNQDRQISITEETNGVDTAEYLELVNRTLYKFCDADSNSALADLLAKTDKLFQPQVKKAEQLAVADRSSNVRSSFAQQSTTIGNCRISLALKGARWHHITTAISLNSTPQPHPLQGSQVAQQSSVDQQHEYQNFVDDFCVKRPRDCVNVSVAANLSLNIAYKDSQATQETAFKQALKEYAEVLGENLTQEPKVSVLYPGLGRSDIVGGRMLIGLIITQKNNRNKNHYVIAFRGTNFTANNPIESFLNATSDTNSTSQSSKVKFHPGFEEHTFGINPDITQLQNVIAGVIDQANKNGLRDDVDVLITGHSLGGASAEIYAARLIDKLRERGNNTFDNIQVITFGAPPAIKESFVSSYSYIPAIRVEKSGDIVMDLTTNGSLNDAYRLLDNANGIVQLALGSQAKTTIQQFREGHYRSFATTHISSDKSPKMQAAQREVEAYDNLNPILKAGVNLNSGALLQLEEDRRIIFNEGISAHLSYGEYYDSIFKNPTLKSRLMSHLH